MNQKSSNDAGGAAAGCYGGWANQKRSGRFTVLAVIIGRSMED
jgi:hypothetical protein